MNDQEARQLVERLAVPDPADPPLCPLCGRNHGLEASCDTAGKKSRRREAVGPRK